MTRPLSLIAWPGEFAVARLPAEADIPTWATAAHLFSITATMTELSIVCPASLVPEKVSCEPGFRCVGIEGTLDFSETGILVRVLAPLAEAGISVFAFSTFDTDYVLVKADRFDAAVAAWRAAGIDVRGAVVT